MNSGQRLIDREDIHIADFASFRVFDPLLLNYSWGMGSSRQRAQLLAQSLPE